MTPALHPVPLVPAGFVLALVACSGGAQRSTVIMPDAADLAVGEASVVGDASMTKDTSVDARASTMDAARDSRSDVARDGATVPTGDAPRDPVAADVHPPSTDVATVFNPCPPAGTPCKIMPAGDSIAVGIGGTGGGHRVPLFKRARADGKSITFVGSEVEGPTTVDGAPFPRQHEGHRGHTIDTGGGRMGVSPLIAAAVTTHQPHIILLMVGTNDLTVELDLANAPARLGALIDKAITAAPNALVVVAQIVPTMDDVQNRRIMTFNAALPAVVKARVDAGKHVVLVDMYGAFTARADYKTSLMFDRVHPNDAGYDVLAGVWYSAISAFLR